MDTLRLRTNFAALVALLLIAAPRVALAQAFLPDPTATIFQMSYYDVATSVIPSAAGWGGPGSSGGAGDSLVHIINPTSAHGALCAMIYVFDDIEEMQACCGCPISPDGLRTLSTVNDLVANFGVNKADVAAGTVRVVASEENFLQTPPPTPGPNINPFCSPGGAFVPDPRSLPVNPLPGLVAWSEHTETTAPSTAPFVTFTTSTSSTSSSRC